MDRGAWWATVHGVTQSWTRPKQLSKHAHSMAEITRSFLSRPKDTLWTKKDIYHTKSYMQRLLWGFRLFRKSCFILSYLYFLII